MDVKVDAYLPDDYVRDERQRMEMYKRIATLVTDADRADVIDELVDRFGDVPPAVETLLDIAQLRAQANKLGIQQITYKTGGFMTFKLSLRHMPPNDVAFIDAMSRADKRLMPSHKFPDVIILAAPGLNEYGMLTEAVKALTRWNMHYEAIVAEQARQ